MATHEERARKRERLAEEIRQKQVEWAVVPLEDNGASSLLDADGRRHIVVRARPQVAVDLILRAAFPCREDAAAFRWHFDAEEFAKWPSECRAHFDEMDWPWDREPLPEGARPLTLLIVAAEDSPMFFLDNFAKGALSDRNPMAMECWCELCACCVLDARSADHVVVRVGIVSGTNNADVCGEHYEFGTVAQVLVRIPGQEDQPTDELVIALSPLTVRDAVDAYFGI